MNLLEMLGSDIPYNDKVGWLCDRTETAYRTGAPAASAYISILHNIALRHPDRRERITAAIDALARYRDPSRDATFAEPDLPAIEGFPRQEPRTWTLDGWRTVPYEEMATILVRL